MIPPRLTELGIYVYARATWRMRSMVMRAGEYILDLVSVPDTAGWGGVEIFVIGRQGLVNVDEWG